MDITCTSERRSATSPKLWALLLLVGCSAPTVPGPPPPPTIETMTPRTAASGMEYEVEILLVGLHFAQVGNVVRVTPHPQTIAPWISVLDLPSNGASISLSLPKCLPAREDGGGPCFLLGLGNYDVTVSTAAGESNAMPLTLCVPWLHPDDCLEWGESLNASTGDDL